MNLWLNFRKSSRLRVRKVKLTNKQIGLSSKTRYNFNELILVENYSWRESRKSICGKVLSLLLNWSWSQDILTQNILLIWLIYPTIEQSTSILNSLVSKAGISCALNTAFWITGLSMKARVGSRDDRSVCMLNRVEPSSISWLTHPEWLIQSSPSVGTRISFWTLFTLYSLDFLLINLVEFVRSSRVLGFLVSFIQS